MRKVEYKYPLDVITHKIFGLFQVFRESNLFDSSEEPVQLVLLMLTLFKNGFMGDQAINKQFSYESFQETIQLLSKEGSSNVEYRDIVKFLYPSLSKIDSRTYLRIGDLLSQLDSKFLKENFAEIFDNVLYRVSQSQGKYAAEFIQPLEITRLICGLADLKNEALVFNPFAGLASFGVLLKEGHKYFGQEVNQKTWAIGALRLMAYGRMKSANYFCDDSIMNWPESMGKFDLVVANPPFGLKLGNRFQDIVPRFNSVEQFLIEKGINSLNQNGKLIALLPQGFLFRGGKEQSLRELLVDEDLIDMIISLPGGLLKSTGIPLVILVVSKTKETPGKVKFIDAMSFIKGADTKDKVLDDLSLNRFLHSEILDDQIIQIVTNEQIRFNEFNLNVARYFQKQVDGVPLGNILELVKGQKGNLPDRGKLVRIKNLKEDRTNFFLDVSDVDESDLSRTNINSINESCLLLAMRWKTLKPTLFEFKDEPIYSSQDILSFKIDEALVDKTYLINELHANYVQEQLDGFRLGTSIAFIRKDDLMKVVIKLPSLKEQRERNQRLYELSDTISILQAEQKGLTYGRSIRQYNEFASLKHTLGRPRQNILDWSDNLLDFLNKNQKEIESLNNSFADFYETDIISVLKEIKRDVNFITDVLERGENGLVLSEYEKQIVSLFDINEIINEMSINWLNFSIKKYILEGASLHDKGIYANKILFKTLLDNILTNANKYAFELKNVSNEVVIELTEVEEALSLEIRNNGKSFPKNFDREKFIAKYSTADSINGSGLGGYDIHRIASDFNNPDWILSLDEDPLYPVKFKFQFPIKPIN